MKKVILLIGLLLVLGIVFVQEYPFTVPDAKNTLEITQGDEKVILEYLDTKTDNISHANGYGKMYSAFKVLGTDQSKIYLWVLKQERHKLNTSITHDGVAGVSLPVVLNIKKKDNSIIVIDHKYPEELGAGYGRSVKRLFPPNVIDRFPDNDEVKKLEEVTKVRAEKDLIKEK